MLDMGETRAYRDGYHIYGKRNPVKTTQLNHVALHVADVDVSHNFYTDIIQLEPMPRPAFDFPGAWYRLGVDQELHLIGGRTAATAGADSRANHWALMIDDMDAWESHLQAKDVAYKPRKIRPDGAFQIYVTDPDGHVLELCTAPTSPA